jgi:PKHD-type hydroxylase
MTRICIGGVLSKPEVAAITAEIQSAASSFQDGRKTAGWQAKSVKNNEQLTSAASAAIIAKVETALKGNDVFVAAARPKTFVKILVSRYKPGMEYGLHVDDPLMGGVRTDMSFTLFLAEPETYDGGELVIEEADGQSPFKLPAGSLMLYPTTSLHRVAPVTSGERLAVVGWVRSFIRSNEMREALFDMDIALNELRSVNAPRPVIDRLLKVRANLTRLHVED